MAVETKERIPSPEELKNDPIKFTEEEVNSLRNLQVQMDQNVLALGRLNLAKMRMLEQEEEIKSQIKKLSLEEGELANPLSTKYGKGSLDIETGTFTPSE